MGYIGTKRNYKPGEVDPGIGKSDKVLRAVVGKV